MQRTLLSKYFSVFVFFALMLNVCLAFAQKVKCPVCGEHFEQDEPVCPNDGTDLVLLGKTIKNKNKTKTEKNKEKSKQKSNDSIEESNGTTNGKYRRHDLGGERQRIEDSQGDEYSDRRGRLGDERRPAASVDERKKKAKRKKREFQQKDVKLRENFEKKRKRHWWGRNKRARDDQMAKQGFENLKKKSLWTQGAPLTSVGGRISWMGEGESPGLVSGAEIDFNVVKNVIRVGLSSFIGIRKLDDRRDLIFLEHVSVGFQKPWRYSPYIVARGGLGALFTSRFGEDLTYLVRSIGAEAGIDCRITRSIVITPSFGYTRHMIDEAYWNSYTMKLSIGF